MKQSTKEFLNGEIKESEFYNTKKEDLVSLKEYYKKLKEVDKKFLYLASIDIKKIKLKLDWVDSVYFAKEFSSSLDDTYIQLFSKDNNVVIAEFDESEDKYIPIPMGMQRIFRFNPKVKTQTKRENDIEQIQEELRKIESAGRFIYYGVETFARSIGTEFYINYIPGDQLRVSTLYDTIAVFHQNGHIEKEKTYLDDNHKSKVLNLIQLDKSHLPRSN